MRKAPIILVLSLIAMLMGGEVLRPVTAEPLSPAPIDQVAADQVAAAATPDPGNQGVSMTAEFARALAGWQPPDASNIPSSGQGGSATWFLDCSSGGVNLQATRGWCFAPLLNIFYNVETRVLLHPLTGRIFTVAPGPGQLREITHTNDDEFEPPTFIGRSASPPRPLSLHCWPEEAAVVAQHVQGLQANAARTDSQLMQARFTQEAQWWGQLCAHP